jgi:hypothetical protein
VVIAERSVSFCIGGSEAMALIKNWGFMWQRKHIFRGTGGTAGHLRGRARGRNDADFREQIGVYVLHDWQERIVYIGQAGNGNATLFNRLKQHLDGRLSERWEYFSWFGFLAVNNDGSLSAKAEVGSTVSGFTYSQALNELDGVLIEIIEPSFNKQGGKINDATEYIQILDERTQEISNAELSRDIADLQKKIERIERELLNRPVGYLKT